MENYRFYSTLSTKGFVSKPNEDSIKKLIYRKQELCLDEFIRKVAKEGYCFNNIYNFEGDISFTGIGVKTNNYIGTFTINIDLDHQPIPMEIKYEAVPIKPTFCFESWSNRCTDYRYRFIYVFDEIIYGKRNYQQLFSTICTINNLSYDSNAKSPYQYMNGSGGGRNIIRSDRIYSISDFISPTDLEGENISSHFISEIADPIISYTHQDNINRIANLNLVSFYEDFEKMESVEFLQKYKKYCKNITHSPFPQVSDDSPMIDLPQDFYEVTRKWVNKKDVKGMCDKIKYGEHRKRILFINLMVRRLVCQDLTEEDLLYDCVYELQYYIDNSDKKHYITKHKIREIVSQVLSGDISTFKYHRPRERMVNPNFSNKYGMSKRTVANKANAQRCAEKRIEKYELIRSYINPSLSIEDIKIKLSEDGYDFSRDTIIRCKKFYGLTRKYKQRNE